MFLFYLWITLNWYAVSPPFCDLILEPGVRFFCSTEESATIRSVVLLVAEDSLRASLFSAIKLDGRESRKVARLQRVNSATETTKMII
jgi:hypothetical protein